MKYFYFMSGDYYKVISKMMGKRQREINIASTKRTDFASE